MATPRTLTERIVVTMLLVPFVAVTGLVTASFPVSLARAALTYTYRETPCEIERSDVVSDAGSHRLEVRYRYLAAGRWRASTVHVLGDAGSDNPGVAARLARELPPGLRTVCFVSRLDPEQAVLIRGHRGATAGAAAASFFVGTFFFLPFSFALYAVHVPRPLERLRVGSDAMPWLIMAGVGATFAMAGTAAFLGMLVHPLLLALDARSWAETPATVLRSELTSHQETSTDRDSSGRNRSSTRTVYGHAIEYAYRVDDVDYVGRRYRFLPGSAGQAENQAIVRRFPAGKAVTCYVDPDDPSEVVLDREIGTEALWGLAPLIFVAAGIGLMVAAFRLRPRGRRRGSRPGSRVVASS